ncbi:MAG: NYN domain-containing protein [Phycisphaerales bacterium]
MLLLDTYNILHVTGVLPPEFAGLDVAGLGELIECSRWRSGKVLLVCDGFGAPTVDDREAYAYMRGRVPRAEDYVGILFAGRGRDADSLIERLLERFGNSRRVTVVSSDHRIKRAAKSAGARHLRSEDFLADLVVDARRAHRVPQSKRPESQSGNQPLTRDEVSLWAREFGLTPDDPLMHIAAQEQPAPPPPSATPSKPPSSSPSKPPEPSAPDPLLLEALRMWPGRIRLEDLDMELWLGQDDLSDPTTLKYT